MKLSTKLKHSRIIEAFVLGNSLESISKQFEVEEKYVKEILRDHDVKYSHKTYKIRVPSQAILDRNSKLIAFYCENNTLEATGKKFGITRERVRQILVKNGIKPRRTFIRRIKSFRPKNRSSSHRLWSKVDKKGPDECWNWTGKVTVQGYGRLWMRKISPVLNSVNKLAFYFTYGYLPEVLLNDCGNTRCCNPAHHKVGTKEDWYYKFSHSGAPFQKKK